MKKIPALILLLFFILSQVSCGRPAVYKKTAILMGTLVEIQILPAQKTGNEALDSAIENALREIRKTEKVFSLYDPESEASRLNTSAAAKPFRASEEFMFLLKKALYFSGLSEGGFDISVVPLENVWRKAAGSGKMPDEAEIKNAIRSVGSDKIIVNNITGTVKLKSGMALDFGAIAKGYAVDNAAQSLRASGVTNAVINAGGDIYCIGAGKSGYGWQIGIKHPRREGCIATLLVKDRAIATSGDYERFVTINGEKFSHIINPKTGIPVEDVPMSVTILAPSCLTADALATSVFVLGPEKGMKLLNGLKEAEGVIISGQGEGLKIETTEGLKEIKIFDEK